MGEESPSLPYVYTFLDPHSAFVTRTESMRLTSFPSSLSDGWLHTQ